MTLPPRPPAWLVALVCAVLAVAFAVLAPPVLWTKLAELVAAIAANPDGALTIAGTLGAMAAAFRAAWMRRPPESTLAMRDLSGNGRDARSKPGHEPTVGDGEPEDDSDDPPPPASSDGPPTRPQRRTVDRIERVEYPPGTREAMRTSVRLLRWGRVGSLLGTLALVALTGCGASALRTHSTIATVARVSVVTAGEAIARTCEVALSRCTDEACIERTSADCTVAGTAAEAAIDGVRAYVDVIEVAALADEGQVAASLDLAVQTMARLYNALRDALASLPSLGVTLPPLPPIAIAVLRALAEQLTGGAT